jgi:hypothetical protein
MRSIQNVWVHISGSSRLSLNNLKDIGLSPPTMLSAALILRGGEAVKGCDLRRPVTFDSLLDHVRSESGSEPLHLLR